MSGFRFDLSSFQSSSQDIPKQSTPHPSSGFHSKKGRERLVDMTEGDEMDSFPLDLPSPKKGAPEPLTSFLDAHSFQNSSDTGTIQVREVVPEGKDKDSQLSSQLEVGEAVASNPKASAEDLFFACLSRVEGKGEQGAQELSNYLHAFLSHPPQRNEEAEEMWDRFLERLQSSFSNEPTSESKLQVFQAMFFAFKRKTQEEKPLLQKLLNRTDGWGLRGWTTSGALPVLSDWQQLPEKEAELCRSQWFLFLELTQPQFLTDFDFASVNFFVLPASLPAIFCFSDILIFSIIHEHPIEKTVDLTRLLFDKLKKTFNRFKQEIYFEAKKCYYDSPWLNRDHIDIIKECCGILKLDSSEELYDFLYPFRDLKRNAPEKDEKEPAAYLTPIERRKAHIRYEIQVQVDKANAFLEKLKNDPEEGEWFVGFLKGTIKLNREHLLAFHSEEEKGEFEEAFAQVIFERVSQNESLRDQQVIRRHIDNYKGRIGLFFERMQEGIIEKNPEIPWIEKILKNPTELSQRLDALLRFHSLDEKKTWKELLEQTAYHLAEKGVQDFEAFFVNGIPEGLLSKRYLTLLHNQGLGFIEICNPEQKQKLKERLSRKVEEMIEYSLKWMKEPLQRKLHNTLPQWNWSAFRFLFSDFEQLQALCENEVFSSRRIEVVPNFVDFYIQKLKRLVNSHDWNQPLLEKNVKSFLYAFEKMVSVLPKQAQKIFQSQLTNVVKELLSKIREKQKSSQHLSEDFETLIKYLPPVERNAFNKAEKSESSKGEEDKVRKELMSLENLFNSSPVNEKEINLVVQKLKEKLASIEISETDEEEKGDLVVSFSLIESTAKSASFVLEKAEEMKLLTPSLATLIESYFDMLEEVVSEEQKRRIQEHKQKAILKVLPLLIDQCRQLSSNESEQTSVKIDEIAKQIDKLSGWGMPIALQEEFSPFQEEKDQIISSFSRKTLERQMKVIEVFSREKPISGKELLKKVEQLKQGFQKNFPSSLIDRCSEEDQKALEEYRPEMAKKVIQRLVDTLNASKIEDRLDKNIQEIRETVFHLLAYVSSGSDRLNLKKKFEKAIQGILQKLLEDLKKGEKSLHFIENLYGFIENLIQLSNTKNKVQISNEFLNCLVPFFIQFVKDLKKDDQSTFDSFLTKSLNLNQLKQDLIRNISISQRYQIEDQWLLAIEEIAKKLVEKWERSVDTPMSFHAFFERMRMGSLLLNEILEPIDSHEFKEELKARLSQIIVSSIPLLFDKLKSEISQDQLGDLVEKIKQFYSYRDSIRGLFSKEKYGELIEIVSFSLVASFSSRIQEILNGLNSRSELTFESLQKLCSEFKQLKEVWPTNVVVWQDQLSKIIENSIQKLIEQFKFEGRQLNFDQLLIRLKDIYACFNSVNYLFSERKKEKLEKELTQIASSLFSLKIQEELQRLSNQSLFKEGLKSIDTKIESILMKLKDFHGGKFFDLVKDSLEELCFQKVQLLFQEMKGMLEGEVHDFKKIHRELLEREESIQRFISLSPPEQEEKLDGKYRGYVAPEIGRRVQQAILKTFQRATTDLQNVWYKIVIPGYECANHFCGYSSKFLESLVEACFSHFERIEAKVVDQNENSSGKFLLEKWQELEEVQSIRYPLLKQLEFVLKNSQENSKALGHLWEKTFSEKIEAKAFSFCEAILKSLQKDFLFLAQEGSPEERKKLKEGIEKQEVIFNRIIDFCSSTKKDELKEKRDAFILKIADSVLESIKLPQELAIWSQEIKKQYSLFKEIKAYASLKDQRELEEKAQGILRGFCNQFFEEFNQEKLKNEGSFNVKLSPEAFLEKIQKQLETLNAVIPFVEEGEEKEVKGEKIRRQDHIREEFDLILQPLLQAQAHKIIEELKKNSDDFTAVEATIQKQKSTFNQIISRLPLPVQFDLRGSFDQRAFECLDPLFDSLFTSMVENASSFPLERSILKQDFIPPYSTEMWRGNKVPQLNTFYRNLSSIAQELFSNEKAASVKEKWLRKIFFEYLPQENSLPFFLTHYQDLELLLEAFQSLDFEGKQQWASNILQSIQGHFALNTEEVIFHKSLLPLLQKCIAMLPAPSKQEQEQESTGKFSQVDFSQLLVQAFLLRVDSSFEASSLEALSDFVANKFAQEEDDKKSLEEKIERSPQWDHFGLLVQAFLMKVDHAFKESNVDDLFAFAADEFDWTSLPPVERDQCFAAILDRFIAQGVFVINEAVVHFLHTQKHLIQASPENKKKLLQLMDIVANALEIPAPAISKDFPRFKSLNLFINFCGVMDESFASFEVGVSDDKDEKESKEEIISEDRLGEDWREIRARLFQQESEWPLTINPLVIRSRENKFSPKEKQRNVLLYLEVLSSPLCQVQFIDFSLNQDVSEILDFLPHLFKNWGKGVDKAPYLRQFNASFDKIIYALFEVHSQTIKSLDQLLFWSPEEWTTILSPRNYPAIYESFLKKCISHFSKEIEENLDCSSYIVSLRSIIPFLRRWSAIVGQSPNRDEYLIQFLGALDRGKREGILDLDFAYLDNKLTDDENWNSFIQGVLRFISPGAIAQWRVDWMIEEKRNEERALPSTRPEQGRGSDKHGSVELSVEPTSFSNLENLEKIDNKSSVEDENKEEKIVPLEASPIPRFSQAAVIGSIDQSILRNANTIVERLALDNPDALFMRRIYERLPEEERIANAISFLEEFQVPPEFDENKVSHIEVVCFCASLIPSSRRRQHQEKIEQAFKGFLTVALQKFSFNEILGWQVHSWNIQEIFTTPFIIDCFKSLVEKWVQNSDNLSNQDLFAVFQWWNVWIARVQYSFEGEKTFFSLLSHLVHLLQDVEVKPTITIQNIDQLFITMSGWPSKDEVIQDEKGQIEDRKRKDQLEITVLQCLLDQIDIRKAQSDWADSNWEVLLQNALPFYFDLDKKPQYQLMEWIKEYIYRLQGMDIRETTFFLASFDGELPDWLSGCYDDRDQKMDLLTPRERLTGQLTKWLKEKTEDGSDFDEEWGKLIQEYRQAISPIRIDNLELRYKIFEGFLLKLKENRSFEYYLTQYEKNEEGEKSNQSLILDAFIQECVSLIFVLPSRESNSFLNLILTKFFVSNKEIASFLLEIDQCDLPGIPSDSRFLLKEKLKLKTRIINYFFRKLNSFHSLSSQGKEEIGKAAQDSISILLGISRENQFNLLVRFAHYLPLEYLNSFLERVNSYEEGANEEKRQIQWDLIQTIYERGQDFYRSRSNQDFYGIQSNDEKENEDFKVFIRLVIQFLPHFDRTQQQLLVKQCHNAAGSEKNLLACLGEDSSLVENYVRAQSREFDDDFKGDFSELTTSHDMVSLIGKFAGNLGEIPDQDVILRQQFDKEWEQFSRLSEREKKSQGGNLFNKLAKQVKSIEKDIYILDRACSLMASFELGIDQSVNQSRFSSFQDLFQQVVVSITQQRDWDSFWSWDIDQLNSAFHNHEADKKHLVFLKIWVEAFTQFISNFIFDVQSQKSYQLHYELSEETFACFNRWLSQIPASQERSQVVKQFLEGIKKGLKEGVLQLSMPVEAFQSVVNSLESWLEESVPAPLSDGDEVKEERVVPLNRLDLASMRQVFFERFLHTHSFSENSLNHLMALLPKASEDQKRYQELLCDWFFKQMFEEASLRAETSFLEEMEVWLSSNHFEEKRSQNPRKKYEEKVRSLFAKALEVASDREKETIADFQKTYLSWFAGLSTFDWISQVFTFAFAKHQKNGIPRSLVELSVRLLRHFNGEDQKKFCVLLEKSLGGEKRILSYLKNDDELKKIYEEVSYRIQDPDLEVLLDLSEPERELNVEELPHPLVSIEEEAISLDN